MKKVDLSKRFLKLAYDQLNPDLGTMEGLEQALINWYCFTYNVPPNDDKLLSMTIEELLVLRSMHKLRDEPALADQFNPEITNYEDWLKEEMGEDYVSEEQMIKAQETIEKEDQEIFDKIKENLPQKIVTDFSNVGDEN